MSRIPNQKFFFITLVAAMGVFVFFTVASEREKRRGISIWLPGTQPGQADTAASLESCRACHAQQVQEWQGSMMAHAPRDPLFNALLAVTSKYTQPLGLDVGEYCLRCHSPSGWLAGRSHAGTVKELYGTDLDGVNCDFCHRSIDPVRPDTAAIVGGKVLGYGNGMYVVQKYQLPVRSSRGNLAHPYESTVADEFFRKSEFCGVCHDVSNPYLSPAPQTTPPHLQVPVERTYSEWKLSWYATRGEAGTCQSCHMTKFPGFGSSLPGSRYRLDVASHDFTGGNTFSPRTVADYWQGINRDAIADGISRSTSLLQRAARVEVAAGIERDSVVALVRLTNLTGHKLPTGFPEGRRIWISVVGKNKNGVVVFESGKYDSVTSRLVADAYLKVYETKPGISPALASVMGFSPGPSFHAAVNDTIYFDNRIPPRGFRRNAFRDYRAEPVGYHYDEGQYWDVTTYTMTREVHSLEVSVWYQVATKEFIEFLYTENVGNPYDWNSWGAKVYEAWQRYGQPVLLAHSQTSVSDTPPELPSFQDPENVFELRVAQNYPNPFNSTSVAEFWISEQAYTTVRLYNLAGQEIQRLLDAELPAGIHSITLSSSELPSGVYLYRVAAKGQSQTKKLLVIR